MYEFNQEIIDALREGKTVWRKNQYCACWIDVTKEDQLDVCLEAVHTGQWSLTKPKKIIQKQRVAYISDSYTKALERDNETHLVIRLSKDQLNTNEILISYPVEVDDDNS